MSTLPKPWRDLADYTPQKVPTPDYILQNDHTQKPGGFADPEQFEPSFLKDRHTYENQGVIAMHEGLPLNPAGPTGKSGRLLGKWGPNHAADPLILRRSKSGLQMLAIERKDTGEWAMPGGMVDKNESVANTLARELLEETGVALDLTTAQDVYRGIVKDDPRNTDNAWMETCVAMLVLEESVAQTLNAKAGDDAQNVAWINLEPLPENLYANHSAFVKKALSLLKENAD